MRIISIALTILLASEVSAQPSFNVGTGSMGCQDVSRQIVRDWFDVKDVLGGDAGSFRPSAGDFRCVSPESVRDALPRHAGGSALKCYKVQGAGICCDAQMQECAMR